MTRAAQLREAYKATAAKDQLYARAFCASKSALMLLDIASEELLQRANSVPDDYVANQLRMLAKSISREAASLRRALVLIPDEA